MVVFTWPVEGYVGTILQVVVWTLQFTVRALVVVVFVAGYFFQVWIVQRLDEHYDFVGAVDLVGSGLGSIRRERQGTP